MHIIFDINKAQKKKNFISVKIKKMSDNYFEIHKKEEFEQHLNKGKLVRYSVLRYIYF